MNEPRPLGLSDVLVFAVLFCAGVALGPCFVLVVGVGAVACVAALMLGAGLASG